MLGKNCLWASAIFALAFLVKPVLAQTSGDTVTVTPESDRVVQNGIVNEQPFDKVVVVMDLDGVITFRLSSGNCMFSAFEGDEKGSVGKFSNLKYIDMNITEVGIDNVTSLTEGFTKNGDLEISFAIKDKISFGVGKSLHFEGNLKKEGIGGTGKGGIHWAVELTIEKPVVIFFGGGFRIPGTDVDTGPIHVPTGWGVTITLSDTFKQLLHTLSLDWMIPAFDNQLSASYEIENKMGGKTLVAGGLDTDLDKADTWLKELKLNPKDKTPIRIVGYSTGTACALALAQRVTEKPGDYGLEDENALKSLILYDLDWGAASMPEYSHFLYAQGNATAFRKPKGSFVFQHIVSGGTIDKDAIVTLPYFPSNSNQANPVHIAIWTMQLWDEIPFRSPTASEYILYNFKLANTTGLVTYQYTQSRGGGWLKSTTSYRQYNWRVEDKNLLGRIYDPVKTFLGSPVNIDHFMIGWFSNMMKYEVMWRLFPNYMKNIDPSGSTNPVKGYLP